MRCERCGATSESQVVPGTLGRLTIWHHTPARADGVLGRPGYLCDRCWWRLPALEKLGAELREREVAA